MIIEILHADWLPIRWLLRDEACFKNGGKQFRAEKGLEMCIFCIFMFFLIGNIVIILICNYSTKARRILVNKNLEFVQYSPHFGK